MEYTKLLYRRQFLLTNCKIQLFPGWNLVNLTNGKYIYSHPDLPVIHKNSKSLQIILLGDIYDYRSPEKNNELILNDIVSESNTFSDFIENIKIYSGQYVFIFIQNQSGTFKLVQDPLALREVYFCTSPNKVICASQPNLVVEFSEPKIQVTQNNEILDFYNGEFKKRFSGRNWIGDKTYFEGVKHLLPNYYLNVNTLKSIRYWPSNQIKSISLETSVIRSCEFLKGILEAASKRNNLMIAVTAGLDSRTFLAASKKISEKIHYFINKVPNLTINHPDIKIPSQIFKDLNIPFHVHETKGEINPDFASVFFKNTFIASEGSLLPIYNVYYKKNLENHLNILGIGEIGRTYFGSAPKKTNGYKLARLLLYKNSQYAVDQCQNWYNETKEIANEFGVNILTLLYWEQKIGNWGAVGNSESDIVMEEFDPFASHYLLETWLGTPEKYVRYDSSILFKEIIKKMWPELLNYPINPVYGKGEVVRNILKICGVHSFIKKVIHLRDEFIYNLKPH